MRFGLRLWAGAVKVTSMPAAVALLLALGALAAAGDDRLIEYGRDALTVRLVKVPVADVLAEVGRQAGAEIRGEVRSPSEVTASFEAVPLPEALHRLLGDQNFALVYANGGQLRAIRLLGGPQTAGTPSQSATPPPSVPPPTASAQDLAGLVQRHGAVPVSGHLAEAIGGPSASLQQLVDLVLHNEDAAARADAMHVAMSTMEGDPALRSALIGQLNGMDDATLSALLRGAAGERAEEVAMQIMTQARASEIRVKASSVLQRLRAGS